MANLIKSREQALTERLDQMQEMDEWHLFQNFVLGLLPHDGYKDVRHSAVRNDFGRDAVALTPKGESCFVAVSFDCTLSKIKKDAKRWKEDPNREDAGVMIFVTWKSPTEIKLSKWREAIKKTIGLELRIIHRVTIAATATREGVWRQTCSLLSIPGYRTGYLMVSPYNREVVQRALRTRPLEWLSMLIPLKEWAELSDNITSRLILGKPGAGKTTTLFTQLERAKPKRLLIVESDLRESVQIEGLLDDAAGDGVIVFDDVQDNADTFVHLCAALHARRNDATHNIAKKYEDVAILVAARSQEWVDLRPKLPMALMQDLKLLDGTQIELTGLSKNQCGKLIEICRDDWKLQIEDRLLGLAAKEAAQRDATPLYVISMLASARARDDRTLKDEHLAGLPHDVFGLWQGYWEQLDAEKQGVLRLIKLFLACKVEPHPHLLAGASEAFEITPNDLSKSIDWLEQALWITRNSGVPTCLDVQLAAIGIEAIHYDTWDCFIHTYRASFELACQLHNGTGAYYYIHRREHSTTASDHRAAIKAAVRHFEVLLALLDDNPSMRALILNNASGCYRDLAILEDTRDGRWELLNKSVQYNEEAIKIQRKLGLIVSLASSLNNASNSRSELAIVENTQEKCKEQLGKAVKYIEESIEIRRKLGLKAELATSLNNASILCDDLVELLDTREQQREIMEGAVKYIEESMQIWRELGMSSELATSLHTASSCYGALARSKDMDKKRRKLAEKAEKCIEESIKIRRNLGQKPKLADSLTNASNVLSTLAHFEESQERKCTTLHKAVGAGEDAAKIQRELARPEELAIALGSVSQHYRSLSEATSDVDEARKYLRESLASAEESATIFRKIGNTKYTVLALRESIIALILLARVTRELDVEKVLGLCEEGIELAGKMAYAELLEYFNTVKETLSTG